MCMCTGIYIKGGEKMKSVFNIAYIKENELLFWGFVISMIIIMLLTIIFVIKETKE